MRLLWILTAILFTAPALAQDAEPEADSETSAEEAVEAVAPEPEPEPEPVDYDESGLDEQGFADEDDDFDPTEAIPTDQSIDFPADI